MSRRRTLDISGRRVTWFYAVFWNGSDIPVVGTIHWKKAMVKMMAIQQYDAHAIRQPESSFYKDGYRPEWPTYRKWKFLERRGAKIEGFTIHVSYNAPADHRANRNRCVELPIDR